MIKRILLCIKDQMKMKEMAIWFSVVFVVCLIVLTIIAGREVNSMLFIESVCYAIVFLMLLIGTKAYQVFIDGYYGKIQKDHDRRVAKKKGQDVPMNYLTKRQKRFKNKG